MGVRVGAVSGQVPTSGPRQIDPTVLSRYLTGPVIYMYVVCPETNTVPQYVSLTLRFGYMLIAKEIELGEMRQRPAGDCVR